MYVHMYTCAYVYKIILYILFKYEWKLNWEEKVFAPSAPIRTSTHLAPLFPDSSSYSLPSGSKRPEMNIATQ